MESDAQSSVSYMKAVLAMAQRLLESDIAIFEHRFHALAFGSWTIVAGRRKERARLSWDGRDGFLTIEQATFPDSRHQGEWEHVKTESVAVSDQEQALQAAERFLVRKFAA